MLQDEGHDKINDNGATEGEKRQVDKIHPYRGGANAQFVAQPLAHAKSLLFKPLRDPVYHNVKIRKLMASPVTGKNDNTLLSPTGVFSEAEAKD